MERLHVDEPGRLLDFLRRRLPGWKRKTLEQRLGAGCVRVNGAPVERREHALQAGDEVELGDARGPARIAVPGLAILHEDDELVCVDKPAGLLSVSTDSGRERSALALLRAALAHGGGPRRLWPVHRLDREASGALLFAKSRAACDVLQAGWNTAEKRYLAVVEGCPRPPSGVIEQPLWEDARLDVHAGPHPAAKDARTRYATQRGAGGRSLVEVELETGRRHQIRVHLAWLGHPIVGDPRYGPAGPRMGLHAWRLSVVHPATGERLNLEAPVPRAFSALLR